MKTKLKAIYGAHPILWTIILLALVIGIGALVYFFPAFGLEAAEIPVVDFPQTAVLEEIRQNPPLLPAIRDHLTNPVFFRVLLFAIGWNFFSNFFKNPL